MEKQKDLLLKISNEVIDLFEFHDFKIDKTKAKKIAEILYLSKKTLTANDIDLFFKQVYEGRYGQLFNNPTCFTAMFYEYKKLGLRSPSDIPL